MLCFAGGACGGGAHGTKGRGPERPWLRAGSAGGTAGIPFLDFMVEERDLDEFSPWEPSRFTSSSDVVESRWAVKRGDFGGRPCSSAPLSAVVAWPFMSTDPPSPIPDSEVDTVDSSVAKSVGVVLGDKDGCLPVKDLVELADAG